jgi:hypothetical protein
MLHVLKSNFLNQSGCTNRIREKNIWLIILSNPKVPVTRSAVLRKRYDDINQVVAKLVELGVKLILLRNAGFNNVDLEATDKVNLATHYTADLIISIHDVDRVDRFFIHTI